MTSFLRFLCLAISTVFVIGLLSCDVLKRPSPKKVVELFLEDARNGNVQKAKERVSIIFKQESLDYLTGFLRGYPTFVKRLPKSMTVQLSQQMLNDYNAIVHIALVDSKDTGIVIEAGKVTLSLNDDRWEITNLDRGYLFARSYFESLSDEEKRFLRSFGVPF